MGGTWGPCGPSATGAASGQVDDLSPDAYAGDWTNHRIKSFAVCGLLHDRLRTVISPNPVLSNTPSLLLKQAAFCCPLQHPGCCQPALPCVGTSCLSCLSCASFTLLCIISSDWHKLLSSRRPLAFVGVPGVGQVACLAAMVIASQGCFASIATYASTAFQHLSCGKACLSFS